MRILLDAHVSGRRVGRRLIESGHDVRSLGAEPDLEGLSDELVLRLAVSQRRILVTHDVSDFAMIAREWAESGMTHAGCLLAGFPNNAYGDTIRGIEQAFALYPRQVDWIDRVEWIIRSGA